MTNDKGIHIMPFYLLIICLLVSLTSAIFSANLFPITNYQIVQAFTPQPEPINHSPIAEDLNVTTVANAPIASGLKGTDQDKNDRLNYTLLTRPVYGSIKIDPS